MQCKKCGFDNQTTEMYCRLCGARMTFTVGRAESSLLDKATDQSAVTVEEELRKILNLTVCVFLLLVTLKVIFGRGNWSTVYLVPSTSMTADYGRITYIYEAPTFPEEKLPLRENR